LNTEALLSEKEGFLDILSNKKIMGKEIHLKNNF